MVQAVGNPVRRFDRVSPSDVVFGDTLGEGAFGLVKIGWLRADPSKKYAIKSMKKHEIIQSKHVDHIENEKTILAKLDHPFSVSIPRSRPEKVIFEHLCSPLLPT